MVNHWFPRISYRVSQFWAALRTTPLETIALEPAKDVLSIQQLALFKRMQPSEQAHALQTLQALNELGETHPDLLTAALLHDVGKIKHPLRLWERVTIVLAKQLFPGRIDTWGRGNPRGWKRPFVIACQHPQWGGDLAHEAGTSLLAIHLIREHQNETLPEIPNDLTNHLLRTLQAADNQN
jgi:hypothetical protein